MVQIHVEGRTGFLAQDQSGIQNISMVRRALALYEVPVWIDLGPNNDGHSKLGAPGNYHLFAQRD